MPVKKRLPKGRAHRITPEAVEAFKAGNYTRLHLALGLAPWEMSPLPAAITALGVDPDDPPENDGTAWAASWPKAVELHRQLIAAAGKAPETES